MSPASLTSSKLLGVRESFPPRCRRRNIHLHSAQAYLSYALLTEFQGKSEEFATPNRVYCARQMCSRFLGSLTQITSGTKVYCCPAP
ncbi:hypothetical protein BKA82DRAFT_991410 [Pisolithus tinctorius]|uniref:Uncharacterized protein n=1 Tax=Pisolithus tinctorius Marx 270 TaxID=870435 RepID=A0A0C3JZR2_PISTI|nr:hypothetical protein BKA82DRAFT_991410 [Pisolithus tinctorius]KIO14648.1 hypothetical protein M404DRAFT_991410 [Pisolithus tinctorius Marx 270]